MEPEPGSQSSKWRPPVPLPSRTSRPEFKCTVCGADIGMYTFMLSTAGHFRGRAATTISVVLMSGESCVRHQDVSQLNEFDSVLGISLYHIRQEWNRDDQTRRMQWTSHEGSNVMTQFVTTAGEVLQDNENIIADDSSGHATLFCVKTDGALKNKQIATSLAICSSCYLLVGGKPRTSSNKEIASQANGDEPDEEVQLAMALSLIPEPTQQESDELQLALAMSFSTSTTSNCNKL